MFTALKRNVAVGIVALTVVGGGAIAWANDHPSRPTLAAAQAPAPDGHAPAPDGQAPAQAQANGRRGRAGAGLLRRAVHGDLRVPAKGGGWQTVTFDRGKVEKVDGDTIVIDRRDGQNVSLTLTSTTRYRGIDGKDGIQVGAPAVVVSKDGNALVVAQRPPGQAAARRPVALGTST